MSFQKFYETLLKNKIIRMDVTIGILLNKYSFEINSPKKLTFLVERSISIPPENIKKPNVF